MMAKLFPIRNRLARLYRFLTISVVAGTIACSGDKTVRPLPELPPKLSEREVPVREVRPPKEFTIAWTGELRGEVEPCGCPTVPYGGLTRRERLLEQLRRDDLPVFVLDAGSMLVKGQNSRDQLRRPERARFLLQSMAQLGLDAWAASPVDLQPGGIDFLKGSGALSANWTDAEGKPVLPGSTIVERGGVRLGILGLSEAGDQQVRESVAALKAEMEGKDVDAWVLLSNLPPTQRKAVAEGVPGLGAVLSVRGDSTDAPERTAGAPILEVPDRGRYVSVLRVMSGAVPGPWEVEAEGDWARYATTRRLGLGAEGANKADFERRIREQQALLHQKIPGRAVVVPYDVALGSELDGEAALRPAIDRFKAQAREAAASAARQDAPERPYQTAAGCMKCHQDRFAAWTFDPHAKAWDALLEREASGNPECLPCHTTGYGEPGGFGEATLANTSRYKAVQCEACHGAMGAHPEDGKAHPAPSAGQCISCHDAANSPSFDISTYLRRISCTMVSHKDRAGGGGGAGTTPPR
jgi:Cytochrome c554 and c-prime